MVPCVTDTVGAMHGIMSTYMQTRIDGLWRPLFVLYVATTKTGQQMRHHTYVLQATYREGT